MKLKESRTLWGIPVISLKEHSKKYRLFSTLLYIFDIIIVFGLTFYMYNNNVDFRSYGFVIVVICLFIHFTTNSFLNPDRWEAFKFYKRHSDCTMTEVTYDLDEDKIYSMLYCLSFKRLKQGKSFDTYKELMLSCCCEDTNNAKKLMKYLKKYESESGNLTCYIITKGKSQFFIDFVNENSSDEEELEEVEVSNESSEISSNTEVVIDENSSLVDGGSNNGDDNTGTVEESESEGAD
jgi:hypothetical protein